MQAAKELIQAKQYDRARTILETVDHPTARDWLYKLDKLSPPKPKKSTWSKIRIPLLLILLVIAGVLGFNAYRSFQETSAASAQMMQDAFTQADVRITLSVYCQNLDDSREAVCDAWATQAVTTNYEGAKFCKDLELWPGDDAAFELCLNKQGIHLDV